MFSLFLCPENWKSVFLYDTMPHNEWKAEKVREIDMLDIVDQNVIHSSHHHHPDKEEKPSVVE